MKSAYLILIPMLLLASCEPFIEPDVELGTAPVAAISYEALPGEPNRIVFTDASSDAFISSWTFGNGTFSSQKKDTAYFGFAGDYTVSLTVAGRGGSSSDQVTVSIATNDPNACSDSTLIYLAGGCLPGDSVAWIFSQVSGAISVGPAELSTEWYTSPGGGLVPEQYDDSWVFYTQDNHFQYFNNGLTVDPFQGYQALPFDAPTNLTWSLSPGTGYNGADQIILPTGTFIGTMDSGPTYDIISITKNEMVLLGPQVGGTGWFTFYLVRK
ncbi:MAG: PKD domain-containing protein [Bacteroidia bacterium]|nr:PKD domain-containing protein [Bacteroidia bacterium]